MAGRPKLQEQERALKYQFRLYARENVLLDLIREQMNAETGGAARFTRADVVRILISDARRKYKIKNTDLAAAMAAAKDQS